MAGRVAHVPAVDAQDAVEIGALEFLDHGRRHFLERKLLVAGQGSGLVRLGGCVEVEVVRLDGVAVSEDERALHHVLELADLYTEIARQYVDAVPPESLNFDPPRFQELVDAAVHLYQSVAVQDGTPEKIEAQRRLEAFLAFTLRVDSDRFSP